MRFKNTKSELKYLSRNKPFPLEHVAIIMDGNRRWADKKHLPRLLGHKEGVKTLKELVKYVGSNGLKYLTVYAFSSENWSRSDEEVNYLLQLFAEVVDKELDELSANKVRLSFVGDLSNLPISLAKAFQNAMVKTSTNQGLSLQVAINYGSRLEITEAVQKIAQAVQNGKLKIEQIDTNLISSYLYTKDIPDPDLLIRTGGEMRLSNYLLWQSAYTEIYVTSVLWPNFNINEFELAIKEFANRKRRFGGD